MNQVVLTGEALPVEKKAAPASAEVQNALDLANLCFLGSNVESGSAAAVVIHTGLKNLLDEAVLAHEELEERLKANEEYRKIDEIPFDFVRRRMSVVVEDKTGLNTLICKEVGLPVEHLLLGSQIETMSKTELAEAARATSVFARLAPLHKERIIHALQSTGHVLGFMGDGINYALALKAADVGISVDSAVDIAKESSDVILLEESLMVLEQGVPEGRRVFGNIVKYIKLAASSNFGNMFSVVGASAFLPFLPMLPIQVLTNNLLYDFSQTTIPTDEVAAGKEVERQVEKSARAILPSQILSCGKVGLYPINGGRPMAYDTSNAGLCGNNTGLAGFSSL